MAIEALDRLGEDSGVRAVRVAENESAHGAEGLRNVEDSGCHVRVAQVRIDSDERRALLAQPSLDRSDVTRATVHLRVVGRGVCERDVPAVGREPPGDSRRDSDLPSEAGEQNYRPWFRHPPNLAARAGP